MSGLILPGGAGGASVTMGEKPHRLLACYDCLTLEKLPPYEGREDANGVYLDYDPVLEHLLEPHRTNGEPHRGMLLRVPAEVWDDMKARQNISRELFKEEAERAAFKDTLTEDANTCYVRHNRPGRELNLDCGDYRSDKKRIGNPSRSRAAAHLAPVYLCDFCPYKSQVITVQRHAAGGYR
jgi:hypothetical protein